MNKNKIVSPKVVKAPEIKVKVLPSLETNAKLVVATKKNKVANAVDSTNNFNSKVSTIENGKVANLSHKKEVTIAVSPNDDICFVYLTAPLDYRRHLLESSRKILFCLKSHQKILLIRQKKLEELKTLKISLKELLYLNKKFRDKLPKYQSRFPETLIKKEETKVEVKKVAPAQVSKPKEAVKEKTELEKLEDSLASIELKLKNL